MQNIITSLFLVVPEPTLLDKSLPPIIGGVCVGLIMLFINIIRDAGKNHNQRIKDLEVSDINSQNRFTQFQLERESLVDKYERRIVIIENKLSTVDKLVADVAKLSNELFHYGKAIEKIDTRMEKMDSKFDKILDEIRKSK